MPNNGFCEIVNFQSSGEIESAHEFEFDVNMYGNFSSTLLTFTERHRL